MSDLKTNEDTSDIDLSSGDLVLTEGREAVAQSIRHRIKMFQGEWFLDLDEGLPYYEAILLKKPRPAVVESLLKQRILSTPGVLELVNFEVQYDNSNRRIFVSCECMGYDGLINFSETLGV